MLLIALKHSRAAHRVIRDRMLIVTNTLTIAELVHVLEEVLRGSGRIGAEEIPVEAKAGHIIAHKFGNKDEPG